LDIELSDDFKNAILEIQIPKESNIEGKKILELGFPSSCLIVLVKRNGKFITPNGQTELKAEDELMIMMENDKEEEQIKGLLQI
jgi:potassium/hydrogen antiporter